MLPGVCLILTLAALAELCALLSAVLVTYTHKTIKNDEKTRHSLQQNTCYNAIIAIKNDK